LETLEDRYLLTTFTVLNTNLSGPGSLDQAILDANANPGPNTIDFNIGQGLQVITGGGFTITNTVVIDATTVPGQQIELNGEGEVLDGFDLESSGNTVRGLSIDDYAGAALQLGSGNLVEHDFFGTDFQGKPLPGGNTEGIALFGNNNTIRDNDFVDNAIAIDDFGGASNLIGGSNPQDANLILGSVDGVRLEDAVGDCVENNLIGTDPTGSLSSGNGRYGVLVSEGSGNRVLNNVISGNGSSGLEVEADNTLVHGNKIGTDITGSLALANGADGVFIFGSNNSITGNIISGNSGDGVHLESRSAGGTHGNIVTGNLIGIGADGAESLGNGQDGIADSSPGGNIIEANVISFNLGNGVTLRVLTTIRSSAIVSARISPEESLWAMI
jgi:hypothetical protein